MTIADRTSPWRPSLGAWPGEGGVHFRVWAPSAGSVEVVLESPGRAGKSFALAKAADGTFRGVSDRVRAGDRYRYLVDGAGPYPDPASRSQPEGVHGPSEVVDPSRFTWTDAGWRGVERGDLILYELHVGTFTPEGTFAGAMDRLPDLAALGVTAVELMPVADFPGRWNWGYDGVSLFAPSRAYGTPDDLRRLVDEAHRLGLAVLLDVVYNHFGPDGNYLGAFSPHYLSASHRTPWGPAVNLDGEGSATVRAFFIENALHWIHEYHLDGLRLDATHALIDHGPRPFLEEFASAVRASAEALGRPIHLIAEDHRNLAPMLREPSEGGWGLGGVWSDDFHHQARRLLAGDDDGVYRDFRGTVADLAATVERGWFFRGEHSVHRGGPRGTDPSGLAPDRFVFFLQNHDRVGNRAEGDRLHHRIDPAAYRAASALLLLAPQIPLMFMGQEWAAGTPFLFFTDHREELGRLVREGRRREFRSYRAFADPSALERIPDPQDERTFRSSQLRWAERDVEPHASTLRLYRALIAVRREAASRLTRVSVQHLDESTLSLLRGPEDGAGELLWLIVRLQGSGTVRLAGPSPSLASMGLRPKILLTTEDPPFAPDPSPPRLDLSGPDPVLHFARPSTALLRVLPRPDAGPRTDDGHLGTRTYTASRSTVRA